jgi:hypothetical protein
MNLPEAEVLCLVCGREARISAVALAEGVITIPTPRCATCPGYPEMVTRTIKPKVEH